MRTTAATMIQSLREDGPAELVNVGGTLECLPDEAVRVALDDGTFEPSTASTSSFEVAALFPESVSRFRRFKSARISEAC